MLSVADSILSVATSDCFDDNNSSTSGLEMLPTPLTSTSYYDSSSYPKKRIRGT